MCPDIVLHKLIPTEQDDLPVPDTPYEYEQDTVLVCPFQCQTVKKEIILKNN